MSLSLSTKGIIVNQVVSLVTKGVIWRQLGEVAIVLLEFRARVSDVASLTGSVVTRDTIIGTLTDAGANVTITVTSSGIVAVLTDRRNRVIINDTDSIRGILDGYSTLITTISDKSTLSILVDTGIFSQTSSLLGGTRITDSSGDSEVRDL